MSILEKDGNKVAAALLTASAITTGAAVYAVTAGQSMNENVTAKAVDTTDLSDQINSGIYIEETVQETAPAQAEEAAPEETPAPEEEAPAVQEPAAEPAVQEAPAEMAPLTEAVLTEAAPLVEEAPAADLSVPAEPAPAPAVPVTDPVVYQQAAQPVEVPVVQAPAEAVAPVETPVEQPVVPDQSVPPVFEDQPVLEVPTYDNQYDVNVAPVVTQPVVDQPIVDQPVADQPVIDQPVVDQPVVDQPVADQPVQTVPSTDPYADLNARIAAEALNLVGVTDGMQCTEVVQLALANAGVSDAQNLWPSDYADMYGYYTDTPQAGNLIYYNQGGNGLDHIAVYIGDGQAVHGNYNVDGSSYTVVAGAELPGCTDYSYIQVCR